MSKLCEHQNYLANMGMNTTQMYRPEFSCPWCPPRPAEPKKFKDVIRRGYDSSISFEEGLQAASKGVIELVMEMIDHKQQEVIKRRGIFTADQEIEVLNKLKSALPGREGV